MQIPKTVVLCTDIFDEFMMSNNLYPIALRVRAVLLAGGARNVARAEGRGSEIILVRLG